MKLRTPIWTVILFLAVSVPGDLGAAQSPPGIILDTDFRSDVDDVGTLALLNALADNGECALLGVMASQTGPWVVGAINAVNTWYGRGQVPIGRSPVDDQRFDDFYAPAIGDPKRYTSTQATASAPDSTALYRRLLRAADDQSVVVVVVGGQTCVHRLLLSTADPEGDGSIGRTGRELIAAKVRQLVIMGGNFVDPDQREHNIALDEEAARTVAELWPTPIVYSGFEIGRPVMTGGALTHPEENPVAKAYELFPAGGIGTIASSSSYDQTALYYAVRGTGANGRTLWQLSEPGWATFPDARTRFARSTGGRHRHLVRHASDGEVAAVIEALMIQPPRRSSGQAASPPNIVFILADDLGQRDLGSYGSTFYETPNLDRLARDGAQFTDAYAACPVCSPTRSAIMTGQYPARTRNTDYFGAPNGFPDGIPDDYEPRRDGRFKLSWVDHGRRPLWPAPYLERLAADHTTLAEALRAAGYATMHAGKWHLGPEGSWPEDHGFEINRGGHDRGGPYGGKKYFSPYGNPRLEDGPEGEHLADRLAEECAQFIAANRDRPFFVSLWFYDVHTPLMAKPELVKKYEAKRERLGLKPVFGSEPPREVRWVQEHAVYAAMVETMDTAVGRVLARIDELGLRDNTLVIFTSDNGGLSTSEGSPTSNLPSRAGKGWLYEGGIRVPLLVRWPGVVEPGRVIRAPVISTDFPPTLLDAAGLPPLPEQHRDGVSILEALRGNRFNPDRALFWHYPHYGNQGGTPGAAIRRGDWKLIEFFEDQRVELYNLRRDLGEQNNLATAQARRARDLQQQLHDWQREVDTLRPEVNPDSSKPTPSPAP